MARYPSRANRFRKRQVIFLADNGGTIASVLILTGNCCETAMRIIENVETTNRSYYEIFLGYFLYIEIIFALIFEKKENLIQILKI